MHRPLSLLCLVALAACSNYVPPEELPLISAASSYQLHVDSSEVILDSGGSLGLDISGREVRLDLTLRGETVEAWVSPVFGVPREYRGAFDGNDLTLVAVEQGAAIGGLVVDVFELRGGVLDGVVRIVESARVSSLYEGRQPITGEVLETGRLVGSATVRPDDVAPEVGIYPAVSRDRLAPWEGVRLLLSEPIDVDTILAALSVNADYEYGVHEGYGDRAMWLDLTPAGWWPAGDVQVTVDGLADPVGNGASLTTTDIARFDSLSPVSTVDFETSETSTVDAWNLAEDPTGIECSSGAGCLVLHAEATVSAGFYTRLDGAISTLTMAVQIRPTEDRGIDSQYNALILVGGVDGGPVHEITRLITGYDTWTDLEVELPSPVSSPGVVVTFEPWVPPDTPCDPWMCGAYPAPNPIDVAVDDITGF